MFMFTAIATFGTIITFIKLFDSRDGTKSIAATAFPTIIITSFVLSHAPLTIPTLSMPLTTLVALTCLVIATCSFLYTALFTTLLPPHSSTAT